MGTIKHQGNSPTSILVLIVPRDLILLPLLQWIFLVNVPFYIRYPPDSSRSPAISRIKSTYLMIFINAVISSP